MAVNSVTGFQVGLHRMSRRMTLSFHSLESVPHFVLQNFQCSDVCPGLDLSSYLHVLLLVVLSDQLAGPAEVMFWW